MAMLPYFPIAVALPEMLFYLAVAVGWIIIQILKKKAGQGKPLSQQRSRTDEQPVSDLNDFLSEMMVRVQEPAEPEPVQVIPKAPTPKKAVVRPAPASQLAVDIRRESPSKPVQKPVALAQPEELLSVEPGSRKQRIHGLLFPTAGFHSGRPTTRRSPLIASLKSPVSRRQAIVYRDIMGTPKGLRKLDMFTVGRGE